MLMTSSSTLPAWLQIWLIRVVDDQSRGWQTSPPPPILVEVHGPYAARVNHGGSVFFIGALQASCPDCGLSGSAKPPIHVEVHGPNAARVNPGGNGKTPPKWMTLAKSSMLETTCFQTKRNSNSLL